jgi:hypothetical protein
VFHLSNAARSELGSLLRKASCRVPGSSESTSEETQQAVTWPSAGESGCARSIAQKSEREIEYLIRTFRRKWGCLRSNFAAKKKTKGGPEGRPLFLVIEVLINAGQGAEGRYSANFHLSGNPTWETKPLAGVYTRWSGFTESVWPSTSCGSLGLLTSQNTIPRAKAAPAKAAMTLGVVW